MASRESHPGADDRRDHVRGSSGRHGLPNRRPARRPRRPRTPREAWLHRRLGHGHRAARRARRERGRAMKITLTEFVTLDGVSQGPGSPTEDTSDSFTRGGWLVPHIDALFIERASEWLDLADGLLLGRRTYEAFARDWPQ